VGKSGGDKASGLRSDVRRPLISKNPGKRRTNCRHGNNNTPKKENKIQKPEGETPVSERSCAQNLFLSLFEDLTPHSDRDLINGARRHIAVGSAWLRKGREKEGSFKRGTGLKHCGGFACKTPQKTGLRDGISELRVARGSCVKPNFVPNFGWRAAAAAENDGSLLNRNYTVKTPLLY